MEERKEGRREKWRKERKEGGISGGTETMRIRETETKRGGATIRRRREGGRSGGVKG